MIVQVGTEIDESRILWKHEGSDEWKRADIDDLIWAYGDKQKEDWIPVSKRLPTRDEVDEDNRFLVTQINNSVGMYVFNYDGNSEEYWKRNVVAWKPFPKPYKMEDIFVGCPDDEWKTEVDDNSAFEEYQDEVRKEYEYLHWDIR